METPKFLPVIEHMIKAYKMWCGFYNHIPKKSRYTLGGKIDSKFIDVLELLQIATYQGVYEKMPTIELALSGVDTLKFLLRITWEVQALDNKKYEAISQELNEVGRQIGGWRKGLQTKTSGKKPEEAK